MEGYKDRKQQQQQQTQETSFYCVSLDHVEELVLSEVT